MNRNVRKYLIRVARQKDKFAYYSDVVKDCGLEKDINLKSEYGRATFTKLLSDISEFENANQRPLLSSMAIYKDDKKNDHGDGFYIVAEKLKKGKFKTLKDSLYGFTEAAECRTFWQNDDNYNKFFKIDLPKGNLNSISQLFEMFSNAGEFERTTGWFSMYIDFVTDVKKLQKNLADHPRASIDNNKLYSNLSDPVRSYEDFMLKWLKEKSNGISSRGQSVLSGENFTTIIVDSDFKAIARLVISSPTASNYKIFEEWWYNNDKIQNRPLLINRAVAACLPENLSSTVDNPKFWYVVDVLQSKYGFELEGNVQWNWFTANEALTNWLDKELKIELDKISTNKLEQQIWRSIFVWLIFEKYHGKPSIPQNELIRRDPPEDGYDQMPPSKSDFKGSDIDFERKAKIDKELGDAGEELVRLYEIKELEKRGMTKQAKLVRIAKHGEGYDVFSFDKNGNEKFIEVKTTTGSWRNRFYLTRHELKFMRSNPSYSLYRVFNFDEENNSGEFFELKGVVEKRLIMEPTLYEVVIKKK